MFISNRQINLLSILIAILIFGLILTFLNIYELHRLTQTSDLSTSSFNLLDKKKNCQEEFALNAQKNTAWVKSRKKKKDYLKHVINSFKAFDSNIEYFEDQTKIEEDKWNILWAHNYPFKELKTYLQSLKQQHCINHFPGTGFITTKVHLVTTKFEFIPRAFRMPDEKAELVSFANKNPSMMFVQKSNDHRGIKIETIKQLDLTTKDTFVQQFIHNPLLIDGHKFDIGVYTILTSANPLRVYRFEDVLFRFCTEKYHPFSADRMNKYVVGDDYLPTWKVPSLKYFYNDLGFSMKGSFDAWLKENKKDPAVVWDQVSSAISAVFHAKENLILEYSKGYSENLRFFELMRFDFIIDDKLRVYLMEANMSPNLSSAHFAQNRLLYERVVFNALSLIGLSYKGCSSPPTEHIHEEDLRASFQDIAVFPEHCKAECDLKDACFKTECQLCKPCLTPSLEKTLKTAFLEHSWKASCLRVVPNPIAIANAHVPTKNENLTAANTLMAEWFRGKCILDHNFC